jgi:hypothetical protein
VFAPSVTCAESAPRSDAPAGRREPDVAVADRVADIDGVPDGYRAMNDRQAFKVMIAF